MRRVFLSFLGLGTRDASTGESDYREAVYELNGVKSSKTKFVQAAEMEILGSSRFDEVIIVATKQSFDLHFNSLKKLLSESGVDETRIYAILITENMGAEAQWGWFEQILNNMEIGDALTVDLTHGYRSIPIVFSTAINFLQKAKNIQLDAVYYGIYEKVKDVGYAPIMDMREFYGINEWAEAVSRLVEDADARKLAQLAEITPGFQAGELNDPNIVRALEELTNTIRNVDINNVAEKAGNALRLVKEKESQASVTGKILLKLVRDKFASLAAAEPLNGKYDKAYFALQLEIIRLLLEHKLYMQAFTVMREFVASIGMIEVEKARVDSAKGRRKRKFFADVFFNMFQNPEAKWDFKGEAKEAKEKLTPYYHKLVAAEVAGKLRDFAKTLADYRNGFDHAWTLKSGAAQDVKEVGNEIYEQLGEIIQLLEKKGILH